MRFRHSIDQSHSKYIHSAARRATNESTYSRLSRVSDLTGTWESASTARISFKGGHKLTQSDLSLNFQSVWCYSDEPILKKFRCSIRVKKVKQDHSEDYPNSSIRLDTTIKR